MSFSQDNACPHMTHALMGCQSHVEVLLLSVWFPDPSPVQHKVERHV
uniref:Uncharacterized protein n=1 Tax=Kryptolebias marmoratus TaxID=37003 RepID=A0A3Q3ALQ5_KRYMA